MPRFIAVAATRWRGRASGEVESLMVAGMAANEGGGVNGPNCKSLEAPWGPRFVNGQGRDDTDIGEREHF